MGPHPQPAEQLADPDEFTDGPGWIWTVYPRSSDAPMVALGHSGREERARAEVEKSLGENTQLSSFGIVIGPGGRQDVCRRTVTEGEFSWRPMFCD